MAGVRFQSKMRAGQSTCCCWPGKGWQPARSEPNSTALTEEIPVLLKTVSILVSPVPVIWVSLLQGKRWRVIDSAATYTDESYTAEIDSIVTKTLRTAKHQTRNTRARLVTTATLTSRMSAITIFPEQHFMKPADRWHEQSRRTSRNSRLAAFHWGVARYTCRDTVLRSYCMNPRQRHHDSTRAAISQSELHRAARDSGGS